MELFQLMNPDKLAMTCVGHAPSCGRRCRNPIAHHNVQAAKGVMRQIVRPVASDDELKEMLFDLAGYTLCRRYHQNQARTVSIRWFGLVQRQRDDEEDRGSDTSEDDDDDSDSDSSTGSGSDTDSDSDDNDDNRNGRTAFNNNAGELRRRFEELETLQREFDELLQRQRQNLQNRIPPSSTATQTRYAQASSRPSRAADLRNDTARHHRESQGARHEAEQLRQEEAHQTAERNRAAARDQLRRERAEQARRDEALRRAEREQAQREAEAKAEAERLLQAEKTRLKREQAEREAKAEAERLKQQQQAEAARLEHERKSREQAQARALSWETAWERYEAAWSEFVCGGGDADVSICAIWPTKSGLLQSCCEEDVRAFFRCRPKSMNRRMVRRQALRWHPDHAARLFAAVADQNMVGEMLRTVTMISQVVIGIMGGTAL